jgi:RNase P/RNase MRP subunit p29
VSRSIALVLTLLLGPTASALADVVHLKNGGTISGTVVRESDDALVVRTPDGTMTVPRRNVARVEKQEPGKTLVALANERAKAGAHAEAIDLYRRAMLDPDPLVADAARAGLERLRRTQKKVEGYRDPPRTHWDLPAGVSGRPVEGRDLQEQFDRARRAIEVGDGRRAWRLLDPLVKSKPEDKVLLYLRGRAFELAGEEEDARADYLAIFGERLPRRDLSAAWLGELARRKLSPERLVLRSPGVGAGWHRTEAGHFAVYHRSASLPRWVAEDLERAYVDVLEAYAIKRRQVYVAGKIQVFLVERRELPTGGVKLNDPVHGLSLSAPDGDLRLFVALADPGDFRVRARHEIAHVLVEDVFEDLPRWVAEGAAARVEPGGVAARRSRVAALAERHRISVRRLLIGEGPGAEPERWRDHAAVLFAALARKLGPRKALKLGQALAGADRPEDALERFKLDPIKVEHAFTAELER